MLNTSSRPSLTQFFIGFLVLLGRSLVDAEQSTSDIDIRSFHKDNPLFHDQYHYDHLRSFHKQYHHHQQAGLLLEDDLEATRCELRDDEALKLFSDRSKQNLKNVFSDNTSITSLLNVCNFQGENFLHYLVNSSDEKFFEGLKYAKSEQIFHKTDSNLTLMDVLIQKNDIRKILPFLFMVESNFEASDAINKLIGYNQHDADPYLLVKRKLYEYAMVKYAHPRSNMGKQVKAYLVKKIQEEDPALDVALLDCDVIVRNFDAAKQQLTPAHPDWYQSAIHRAAKNHQPFAKIEQMTTIESLRALQSLPQQIPLMHPAFRKISFDLNVEAFEFLNYHDQLTYSLEAQNTIQAVLKYSGNKDRFTDKEKIQHIYKELEILTEPYRNDVTMNILFDELIRIQTALALSEGDLRKALSSCLQAQFLFPIRLATLADLQRMYSMREKIFQTSAEEMLFLRFLLTQENVLSSPLKATVMVNYQNMLRHQQQLLTEPLFKEQDALDEHFILNLYPEAEAREILALERGEPVALWQQKEIFNLWLIGLATTVAVIFVLNYLRKFIPNNSQNQRKKPVITAAANQASTINQPRTKEVASLAEIVLDAASDYYSSDNKETLNALISSLEKQDLEQTPLHLKEQVDREKISKLLLRLYRNQQNAYEIAITLLGVRKDEALKQISDRCKKQIREYSLELIRNATTKSPQPAAPIIAEENPQQLIDKINQLFDDPFLPLDKRWGAYPKCESHEIKFTVGDYMKNGAIARQLTELKQQYKILKNLLTKLTEKKEEYLQASKIDLTVKSDVTELKQIQKNILRSQKDIKQLITQTEETTVTINDAIGRIMNKYVELSTKPIKQVIETPEQRAARLARVTEAKAKRKADKKNAIQNQQRQELELETRIKGYKDPTGEEKEHFTRAYAALQHLRDIQHPKEQITPCLTAIRTHEKNMGLITKLLLIPYQIMELESLIAHDAAILAMIQLHEALLKLAHSAYKSLLPKAAEITELRNYFAHQIMFISLENADWENNIKACYQAYGNFVEYFNDEKRTPRQLAQLVRVDSLPALNRTPVNVDDISFENKKTLFAILCNRYQAYNIILNHQVEKLKLNGLLMVSNNDEIHLVMTAMRSLVVQLREVGKSIGITPANEVMAPLAGYRNEEAHLGDYTDAETLLNLNESVEKLVLITRFKTPKSKKVAHNRHILLPAPKAQPESLTQLVLIRAELI